MALRDWLRVRPGGRRIRRALVVLLVAPILLIGGEALVRARLDPPSSADSAVRIYARPFTFSRGDRLDQEMVEDRLQRLGYRRARGGDVGIGEFYLGSRGWVVGRRAFRGTADPSPAGFGIIRIDRSDRVTRVEDEEGMRLSSFSLEPELIGQWAGQSSADRIPVDLNQVPPQFISALLTVEDQRFFEHNGLDFRRIGAAFAANLRAGRVVQGGSTLTQQLAKNLYLTPRRSVVRKVREASMALTLELRHTKEEILQAYLNQVYLGQDGAVAIHGVARAAEHFFGKDVAALGLPESALLVALIRAPSAYSPYRNPETARARRDLVLRLMRDGGVISEEEFLVSSETRLGLREKSLPPRSARYFVDYVAAQVGEDGPNRSKPLPSALVTTLDVSLQQAAEDAVERGLARLERDFDWLREGEAGAPLQAALVALDPRTGEVLAMVGGRDYGHSQFNRATHARRQPGSAFKPLVAMAALARPGPGSDGAEGPRMRRDEAQPQFTLASVLEDGPFQVETPVGLWQPANYDGSFGGNVTLREALERSLNVPFARLGLAVGPEKIVETAVQMGIESPLFPYPSIALGASEVSPIELTRAFGVLASGGYRPDLKTIYADRDAGNRVFDAAETYLVTSALRGAVERGTGKGIRERGFLGEVAAKSGTTNDFRDGWFVGYTPSLVVGVWVGFDHGKRLELPGAGLALPIFTDFLKEATGSSGRTGPWGSEGFAYPSGLEMVSVDPSSGLRGGWGCRGEPELFLRGSAPEERCNGSGFGDGFRVDERTLRLLLENGGEEVSRLFRRLFRGEGRN